jgi:hypothetical protein
MPQRSPTPLPIAVRVYPDTRDEERDARSRKKPPPRPAGMFVFDTESRTDETQRLTFGSYRLIENGETIEEALFYADDLPGKDRKVLERYVATHPGHWVTEGASPSGLLSRTKFLEMFYRYVYKARCLLVAFNLPFDFARIAYDSTDARREFTGGFSIGLWSYVDKAGRVRDDPFRPRVGIKQIDSKRAIKSFIARKDADDEDRIPEGSLTGKPKETYVFHGHFLDLRTLAFALTDQGHTLESACKEFLVEHPKQTTSKHGIVTAKYIDYNRRDVVATAELAAKLLAEYDRHELDHQLQETKAYSPASIGKAYLRKMGIKPILERQPRFPKAYLGYAQSAFFGGRTSAHIRKVAVPVVYTDFLSMYPTVNSLMGLWRFVTAQTITIIEHCHAEVISFLEQMRHGDLFEPEIWTKLNAFVKVIPQGDILPSRSKYNLHSHDWQVAINHLWAPDLDPSNGLWFSLPDVVASFLLTNKVPQIIDAFRLEAQGKLRTLNRVKLRGEVLVNPRNKDFFKVAIQERVRLASRDDLSGIEKKRLEKALKVLANATSYGIYAEMNRQESDAKVTLKCHGLDPEPYSCRVSHPEVPGAYCFPPLSSLITGAARLMLALLESSVIKAGGQFAMEDTDSMAIVSTERGSDILCPGGDSANPSGVVKALSWTTVREISDRFIQLNPYDRSDIPGFPKSILKIEDDNFVPNTTRQRQLYCFAISAKRYALFLRDQNGKPVLLREKVNNENDRWSEHGLGHLLNPSDPDSDDRDWIRQVWLSLVRQKNDPSRVFPEFQSRPAVGRTTISSPAVMRPLEQLNEGKQYRDQVKPFNFLTSCQVKPLGHPLGTDPEHFHLIAPYQTDSTQWTKMEWRDQYSGNSFHITTVGHHGDRHTARVKSYKDVLQEYEFHPESKCADAAGALCGKQTIGLLQRRHIQIDEIKYIGKESNSLEEVEAGLIHSAENVYTEYPDPRRDEWHTKILPALRKLKLPQSLIVRITGLSPTTVKDTLAGRSRPRRKNRETLASILRNAGQI